MMSKMSVEEILRLLNTPTGDRRPIVRQITARASISELVAALQQSSAELVRHNLIDILGEHRDTAAIPVLVSALHDSSPKIRGAAADALAKIGSFSTGENLLQRLMVEEAVDVCQMIVVALGAVAYRPAIPILVEILDNPDGTLRGCAAWSLGKLGAKETEASLRRALVGETNPYAATRMEEALNEVGGQVELNNLTGQ